MSKYMAKSIRAFLYAERYMVTSDTTAQNANKKLNSSINVMAEDPRISVILETHNIT